MNKLLLFLSALLLLSGCGLFRKVDKQSTKHKENTESASKSTLDSSYIKIDNSTTTERKILTEAVVTPGLIINASRKLNLSDLYKGVTILDSGLISISQSYDSISNTLSTHVNLKPGTMPAQVLNEKITSNNIKETGNKKVTNEDKKTAETEVRAKSIQKEPSGLGWWWLAIIGVFFIATVTIKKIYKR